MNRLIYGKGEQDKIVSIEFKDNYAYRYIADGNKTRMDKIPHKLFVLLEDYDPSIECGKLKGKNDFQYYAQFSDKKNLYNYRRRLDYEAKSYWRCYNDVESYMIAKGDTYYKNMKMSDVSILSFDIETTGVKLDDTSFITLITNTFRDRFGAITRRMFSYDSYDNQRDMLQDWCKWVREQNPDILCGHNIYGFDLPYIVHIAKMHRAKLILGRDATALKVDRFERKFRKDGSQQYEYVNCHIFGREIIDTYFLSFKYDVGRKYPNNKLKDIIAFEGLEKEGRQHWDFSKNKQPWNNPTEWRKFKQYAEEDADDALALFDLMAPQFFYYTQSIPKSFQEIINTATGSQVNSFMLRSYLQDGNAVPKACEKVPFEGAISIGIPGIYSNVLSVDFHALYPSIIQQYGIYNNKKDPNGNLLKMTESFAKMRVEYKELYKKTGEDKYNGMQMGAKVFVNSIYGFMGAPGLNFNYPAGAAKVTRIGRELLNRICKEVTGRSTDEWK